MSVCLQLYTEDNLYDDLPEGAWEHRVLLLPDGKAKVVEVYGRLNLTRLKSRDSHFADRYPPK